MGASRESAAETAGSERAARGRVPVDAAIAAAGVARCGGDGGRRPRGDGGLRSAVARARRWSLGAAVRSACFGLAGCLWRRGRLGGRGRRLAVGLGRPARLGERGRRLAVGLGRPARLGGRGRRLAVGLGRLFRVGGRRGRGRPMPRHQLGRHGQRGPWGLETRMGLAPRRVVSPVRVRVSPLEIRKIFVTASVRRARRGA